MGLYDALDICVAFLMGGVCGKNLVVCWFIYIGQKRGGGKIKRFFVFLWKWFCDTTGNPKF